MNIRNKHFELAARLITAAFVVAAVTLAACGSKDPVTPSGGGPAAATPVCLDFEDQTNGSTIAVGNSISCNGVEIQVEQFQGSSGSALILDRQQAGGAGLDIYPNNCDLNFRFDYPGTRITLKFGDYGGGNNIRINGVFQIAQPLSSLNGATIDGVLITIPSGNPTTMTLDGDITGFTIGGQELLLDDVCFTPAQ
jgi:hypothetical protein